MPKRDRTLIIFGQNVRKRREALGLTQEKLAENADIDRTYVSDIERGTRNPGIKNVARLARALRTTASELTEGIESE